MTFDVEAALRDGYTEDEVADFLAQKNRFDSARARQDGYSAREIIDHLQGQKEVAFDAVTGTTAAMSKDTADPLGAGKTLIAGISRLPSELAATAIQTAKGQSGATVTDKGILDRFLEQNAKDREEFIKQYGSEAQILPGIPISVKDVAELPSNLAFSGTSAVTGLAAGVATALATKSPALAWTAGGAASGTMAYRATANQIMQQYLEAMNETSREKFGRDITPEEEEKLKSKFSNLATAYGLYEAIPEAIGNVAELRIITKPLAKMVGKDLAAEIVKRIMKTYGMELSTETITQIGQQRVESEAGLTDEAPRSFTSPSDIAKSAAEVAPQVFLLTTVMGGAAAGGTAIYRKYSSRKVSQIIQDGAEQAEQIPDDQIDTVIKGAEEVQKRRPNDEKLKESVDVIKKEKKRRTKEAPVEGKAEEVAPYPALPQDFFDQLRTYLVDGKDKNGNPFDIDHVRSFREKYASQPKANPESIRMLDQFLEDMELGNVTKPTEDTTQLMHSLRADAMQGLPMDQIMARGDELKGRHPQLTDEINKLIIEFQGKAIKAPEAAPVEPAVEEMTTPAPTPAQPEIVAPAPAGEAVAPNFDKVDKIVAGMTGTFRDKAEALKAMEKRGEISKAELGHAIMALGPETEKTAPVKKAKDTIESLLDEHEAGNITVADIAARLSKQEVSPAIQKALDAYEQASAEDRFEYGMRGGLEEEAEAALMDVIRAEVKKPTPKPERAEEPNLEEYAGKVVGKDIKSVSLVGSSVKGKGRDIDIVYDFGKVDLPEDTGKASEAVEALLEKQDNIDLDLYDTFIKADGRYFHVSSGAGRAVVENTEYGKAQEGKPVRILAGQKKPPSQEKVSEEVKSLILHDMRTALEEGQKYGMRDDETAQQGSNVTPIGTTNPPWLMDIVREMKARHQQTIGKAEIQAVIRKELEGKGHTLTPKQLKIWFIIEGHLRNESQNPHYIRASEVMSGAKDALVDEFSNRLEAGEYDNAFSDLSFPPTEKEIETAAQNVVSKEVANGNEEALQTYTAERGEAHREENEAPAAESRAEEVTPKTEKTKAGTQAVIPGASEAETFMLTGAPGEVGTAAPKGAKQETASLEEVAEKKQPPAKQPWEMQKKDFIKDSELSVINNEKEGPKPNKYKEGDLAIDDYGDNPYVYQLQYIDPQKIEFGLEGETRERVINMPSTQKYIEWSKQGIEPSPITVVLQGDKKTPYSTNRRRVIAAQEAGTKKIPAFVEIGRHKDMIEQALSEGKPVPKNVLDDYPELKKATTSRADQIRKELDDLQKQYEKKMAQGGRSAMVPPSIKSDALSGITKKMDKLEEELRQIEAKPTTEEGEKGKLKIGDEQRIMGNDAVVAKIETHDGVSYALLNAAKLSDKRGYIRVFDEDSGKVVSVNEFPTYDAAETKYNQTVSDAKKVAGGKIEDFGEKVGGARKDTAERGYSMSGKAKKEDEGPAWRKKFVAMEKVHEPGKWVIGMAGAAKSGMMTRFGGQVFSSQEEAEKAIPLYAVAQNHSVYQNDDKTFSIYKRVSDRKRLKVVNKDFPSREEAMKHMALHAEELLNLKTNFGEEILPVPEIAIRKGEERRTKDATPEMFMETFAPRGIEFGNWNNQEERQQVMNHAYDGLLDLADALGLPPKALMLNGELAIAFGARGQGLTGAKAHYETDYGIINLTKMKGAGSLAHEWLHALDHYLGRQDTPERGKRVANKRGDMVFPTSLSDKEYASSGLRVTDSGVRKELKDAFESLLQSMYKRAEQFVEDTKQADKFLGTARKSLSDALNNIRADLSRDLTNYHKSKGGYSNKPIKFFEPASAEQLAEFDRLASILVEGGSLETAWRNNYDPENQEDAAKLEKIKNRKQRLGMIASGRHTNDTLEAINAIIKAARNHQGFNKEQTGSLDKVRAAMGVYKARIKMFEEAEAGTEKTRMRPTSYAIEAKKMDQARTGDYWSEPREMAARAFAAYVEDKIAEKGGQSDFLVYQAHGGFLLPMIDGFVARPYPEGAEREAINKAFDKFIATIQTRETPQGVEMYEVREGRPATIAKAKELAGKHGSWADFKHKLMDYLEIPRDQFMKWDVPVEWQYAYKRAGGWSHEDTVRQLKLPKDFDLRKTQEEQLSVRDAHRRGLLKPAKIEDVKKFFPGQEVGLDANKNIYVKTRGGKYVTLYKVDSITPDSAVLQVGYGTQKLAPGAVIPGAMGVTHKGDLYIKLHRTFGDTWTLAHESMHFLETSGIINSLDVSALKAHIKRLHREGKWETANKQDVGGPEDRANFIADRLAVKEQKGPIGRIILRIRAFIDGILESFGIRSPESILRGIESGRVFERTGREGKRTNPNIMFEVMTPELPDFMQQYLDSKAEAVEKEFKPFAFDEKSSKNEGLFQLHPSKEFKDFRRVDSWYGVPLTDGVYFVVGTREGYREPHAIRFNKAKFTEAQAKDWWERHKKQFSTVNLFRPKAIEMPAFEPGKVNDWLNNETELNVQHILKREKDLAKKTAGRMKPSNLPHNTWLENMLKSFEWMDHPVLSRIVKIMMSTRSELYHENFNFMTDNKVIEETRALRRKGLSRMDRAMGKTSEEYQLLGKMIDYLDLHWKRNKKQTREEQLKAQEEWMKANGATADIIKVWKLHRESYDKGLDLMTAQMRGMIRELDDRAKATGEDVSKLKQTLEYHLAQMDEWKGSYAPRVRSRGSWWVWAHRGEGEKKEYVMDFRGSSMAADRLASKLKEQGWTVSRVEESKQLPEEIQQQIKTVAVSRAIEKALEDMKRNVKGNSDLILKFHEELLENVADEIKARGFRSSMIHRNTDKIVKGYKEDPLERLVIYTNNTSSGLAKATSAKMATNELFGEKDEETGERIGGIDPVKDKRTFATAQLYMEEQLRNADQTDRLIAIAKAIATFKYLGLNLRSAFVNTTALATTAPPAIQQYALDGKVGFHKIMNALASASKDYARIMIGGKLENADEQSFLEDIKRKGYDDPQYTREAMGSIQRTQHRALSLAMDVSMYVFGKTEQWNRGTTMLAAYRLARKQGFSPDEAADRAHEASNKAHGIYGKATMPSWAMGRNPLAKVGQLAYVYAKFGHNYLQMLYDLGMKKKNIGAFTYAMLAPLVVGGMAAFPFREQLFAMAGFILRALFGEDRDPEKWVWDQIRKQFGSTGEAIGRHGITGYLGLDISSSLSIGVGVPKGLGDLAGPAGGVVEDVSEAWRYAKQGQGWRTAEKIAPRALENPIKAIREAREGAVTKHGYRVWDEKGKPFMPTDLEATSRAFGFRSTRQAVISERTNEAKREMKSFDDRKDAIYERYRAYLASEKKDPAEHRAITQKVREYNEGLRKAGISKDEVPRITFESMRRQAQRMRKPTKQQKAMLD